MPFYLRTRPARPLWQPAAAGSAVLLVLTLGRALFDQPARAAGGPGILARLLYILGFSLAAGLLSGATAWGLRQPAVARSRLVQTGLLTLVCFLALIVLTAAGLAYSPAGVGARILRPGWLLSSGILAVAAGAAWAWVILPRREAAARVYLSPADFAKLPAAEQALLTLAPDGKEPGTP